MAATYSGDPASSAGDEVRYLIGDTQISDVATVFLQDEEIAFRIANEPTTLHAAQRCCEDIVARLTRETDWSTGAQSKSKSQQVAHYRQLSKDLKMRRSEFVSPSAGGLSVEGKKQNEDAEDLVQGHFRSDQFRNPARGEVRQHSGDVEE